MESRSAGRPARAGGHGRVIVSLQLRPFELWWAEHEQPELRDRPLVTTRGKRVLHANAAALSEGVVPGLTLVNARLRTPNLTIAAASGEQLRSRWKYVLEQLHLWSPWLLDAGPGSAWLVLTAEEAHRLPREFRAQAGAAAYREISLAAALGSSRGELQQVQPGTESAFLDALPVSQLTGLGLSAAAAGRLEHLGVRRAGELRLWQETQVRAVLGEETTKILPLLKGPWNDAVPLYRPERSLECSYSFTDAATEPWQVEPVLRQLAWHLSRRLGREAATRMIIGTESNGLQLLDEAIPKNPVSRPEVLLRMLQRSLSRTGALSLGIDRLSVTLRGMTVLQVQHGLWPQRQAREQAIRTVHRRFPGALLAYQLLDPWSLARDQRYRLIQLDHGATPPGREQKARHGHANGTAAGFPTDGSRRKTARTAA